MARMVRDYQASASKLRRIQDVMKGGGRQIIPRGTGTMPGGRGTASGRTRVMKSRGRTSVEKRYGPSS